MEWWKRLAQLREEKNVLQEDVAKYLGVARSTYAGYELGKSEPGVERLKKLAIYFECSLDYLVCAIDERNTESIDLTIASIFKNIKVEDLTKLIKDAREHQDED